MDLKIWKLGRHIDEKALNGSMEHNKKIFNKNVFCDMNCILFNKAGLENNKLYSHLWSMQHFH